MCPIQFHTRPEYIDQFPHPYPASDHTPDWLKAMPVDFTAATGPGGTLKRCPPFVTAMTAGYIIPAPADSTLILSDTGEFSATGKSVNYLGTHFKEQVAGWPLGNVRVVKFINPWIIVTPPEYVCLITAPINRFEIPFTPLTGIVETGTFYQEINLPMACAMRPGERFRLLRGMPMIQVIPILREEFSSTVGVLDPARYEAQKTLFAASSHYYKENFWKKLTFG